MTPLAVVHFGSTFGARLRPLTLVLCDESSNHLLFAALSARIVRRHHAFATEVDEMHRSIAVIDAVFRNAVVGEGGDAGHLSPLR